MQQPVPLIYAPRGTGARLGTPVRLGAAAVSAAALGLLALAAYLRPDPAGFGTHQQLGLTSCSFLDRTGLPCPTCGMTTSFACLVRGQVLRSAYVQPMGTALGLTCAMTFWAAAYVAWAGRPVHRLLRFIPTRYYLIGFLGGGLAAWAWKMMIHAAGHDGWL